MHADHMKTLSLKIDKKGKITAGMFNIDPEIEILNPRRMEVIRGVETFAPPYWVTFDFDWLRHVLAGLPTLASK